MTIVLLIAGIGFLLAGLLAIILGIPVKEFSFGNTLILAGVISACTGVITLCLSLVVRELKAISARLGSDAASLPAASITPRDQIAENTGFPFSRGQQGAAETGDAEPP